MLKNVVKGCCKSVGNPGNGEVNITIPCLIGEALIIIVSFLI